jgi:hypothetical protein
MRQPRLIRNPDSQPPATEPKLAGAAQAATAAVGVALVGLTLLYAGMRRTPEVARVSG